MKTTRKSIELFLEPREIAIAGVSRDPKKFGSRVFQELKEKGFTLYPVNPNPNEQTRETWYSNVSALPQGVKNLLIVTPKSQTLSLVKEASEKGMTGIWIQQMSETPEAIEFAASHNLNLIYKQCILMHADPVKGFHKFHRNLKKFFGALPR